MINEKEPFLWDEYDSKSYEEKLEEYDNNFEKTFCQNCKLFDGVTMCLHGDNIGQITNDRILRCKRDSMFEAK
jgi:hypothetical protein